MAKFRIEKGQYGKKMVLEGDWSNDLLKYYQNHNIKELYLNIAFGWPGYDISFLKDLKQLEWLHILTSSIEDASSIHSLHNLKYLCLSFIAKSNIDFSSFPNLEKVALPWSPKVKSIFQCKSLKRISVRKYRSAEKDLSAFSNLPNLEELCFKICNIEKIGDISSLKKLKTLEFHWASKLTSLEGLEFLKELRILHIDTCRHIKKIDPVGKLEKLEEFYLPNCKGIESLKPMANLRKLRIFEFPDSTNIVDGDLTVLRQLPTLSKVCFVDRRHYNLQESEMSSYKKPNLEAFRRAFLKGDLSQKFVIKL